MEAEAHGHGVGEERELVEVGILDIGYLRCIVLLRAHIDIGSLVRGEGGVLLRAVDLSEEGVGVIAIEMKKGEFCSAATDIKLGRALVRPEGGTQGKLTTRPIGNK